MQYVLTRSDLKKCCIDPAAIPSMVAEMVRGSKKTGSRLGMQKRDLTLSLMRQTRDYRQGLGQGRLDKLRGLDYAEQRGSSEYNLGYYEGWHVRESELRDLVAHNPNFSFLMENTHA
jgi:hypothetical protein